MTQRAVNTFSFLLKAMAKEPMEIGMFYRPVRVCNNNWLANEKKQPVL
jgi:hypothetical protein